MDPRRAASSALSYGPVTAHDNEAKANLLNEYFVSCFNTATIAITRSFLPNVTDDELTAYDCTPEEAAILLKGIKSHTATGPDEISSWMLYNFPVELSSSVSSLFNLSIRTRRLPAEWKLSHTLPIPKLTTNHDVGSFRPISLLSLLSINA